MYFKLWAAVVRHTYSTWDIDLDVVQAGILNITRSIRFRLNCCGIYVNEMSTVDVKKCQNFCDHVSLKSYKTLTRYQRKN